MARGPAYATKHSGRAPPWRSREVAFVLPMAAALSIRREIRRRQARHDDRFTIRGFGTVVVWNKSEPVGSFTLVQNSPARGLATIRRIEWDETQGYSPADIWQAIELLSSSVVDGQSWRSAGNTAWVGDGRPLNR